MKKVLFKVLSSLEWISQQRWRFRQPLTQKPSDCCSVVSDLFVWRKGQGWRTFFELTDIASLFGESCEQRMARVLVFNRSGDLIGENTFATPSFSKLQIDISELAASCQDYVGTFCVFHSPTPDFIANLGCNLTERGYVSYCYGEPFFKSCVHGNLDAVSCNPSGVMKFIGGVSFLKREYRVQHDFKKGYCYDLAVVNASAMTQSVKCKLISAQVLCTSVTNPFLPVMQRSESGYHCFHVKLKPGACHLFHIDTGQSSGDSVRVVIESNLVMLRPIVFQSLCSRVDVFHG